MNIVKSFSTMLDPKYLVQNTYLFSVLTIFLSMYGPRLHTQLPESLKSLFNNPVFRGIVLFLICYLSSTNFQTSIVITVVFLVTMNLLHTNQVFEKFERELFLNGPPVSQCSNYTSESIQKIGNPIYPINDDTNEF